VFFVRRHALFAGTTGVGKSGGQAVAAVASYEHAYALVRAHGEAGWTGRLVPLTVDGLIYAISMVMLDSARRKVAVPLLARWLPGLGVAAAPEWAICSHRMTDATDHVASADERVSLSCGREGQPGRCDGSGNGVARVAAACQP
jgi:hypothetical protein